jgi:putative peptidoglycan lipid II flippase
MSDARGGRSAFVVGAGILISRVVGLLRNTAFAYYFGSGAASDAYNAAFKIPNAVRNLLGEGTLSASFVPVYSRMLVRDDPRAARALANAVLGLLLVAVSLLTLAGIAAAPILTSVLAPGFDPATQELTTRLTRVLFPMTGLMVLSGWCLGIQNSHRRFFWSYASAALWSVAQIALLLVWGRRAPDAMTLAYWLAWATLGGAVLQIAAQMPEVLRLAGAIRPSFDRSAEGVMQTLRNILPVVTALGFMLATRGAGVSIACFISSGASLTLAERKTNPFLAGARGLGTAASDISIFVPELLRPMRAQQPPPQPRPCPSPESRARADSHSVPHPSCSAPSQTQ